MQFRAETIRRAQSFAAPLLAVVGALEVLYLENYTPVLIVAVVITAGIAILILPPIKLFHFYFIYLMLEGALKLWTRYNPLIHVGSDILLVFAFFRLWKFRGIEKMSEHKAPATAKAIHIVIYFLVVFWVWVGVQFLNPWGIGLLPSVAGLKLYAVPMLCFLAVCFLLEEKEMVSLLRLIVILGLFQSTIALIDWVVGPKLLISLTSEYSAKAAQLLRGGAYRPFGTTSLPGGPSTWIFQCLISVLLLKHLSSKNTESRVPRTKQLTGMLALFVPLGVATLLVCQIRLTLIRSVIVGLTGLMLSRGRSAWLGVFSTAGLILYLTIWTPAMTLTNPAEKDLLSERIKGTIERARSLENLGTWKGARGGTHAFEELERRAGVSILGIGLSRVGAATAPWGALISQEPNFRGQWMFADNVFLAIFSELGLAGLLAYLSLAGVLILQLFGKRTYVGSLCGVYCFTVILSGYATEGILYQPEASFFWLYGALGLRLGGGEGALC